MRPARFPASIANILVLTMVSVGLPLTVSATTPFVHDVADSASNVGQFTSLELDVNGNPHITYYESSSDSLRYARRTGGVWVTGVVAEGSFNSLALDTQGNPVVSVYGNDLLPGGLPGLYVATSESEGLWIRERLIEPYDLGRAGLYNSLALSTQDVRHVSYYDLENGNLKYFSYPTDAGNVQATIDTTGVVGLYTSIAVDALGNPHVSYYDSTNGDLKYAVDTAVGSGMNWMVESVDTAGDVGQHTSIALDAQGYPHISYYDASAGALKYASRTANTWTIATVDTAGVVGQFTSLALDEAGAPCISYYDVTTSSLKYARRTANMWLIETVDASGDVGEHTSLAIDAHGNPRISYYDAGNAILRYTDSAVQLLSPVGGERWAAGSQQTVRWSGAGTVSIELSDDGGFTYSSIVSATTSHHVDITVPPVTTEQARLRVSRSEPASISVSPGFFSISPGLVSPWWSKTPDATGDVGLHSSLALDEGNAHISYYDATNRHVKYAVRTGLSWTVNIVDTVDAVSTSLALDAEGKPRIAYYDSTTSFVRFASRDSTGSSWTTEVVTVVDSAGTDDAAATVSLALDPQGNPHIAFFGKVFDIGAVMYATRDFPSPTWTVEVVAPTLSSAAKSPLELQVDAEGAPHVSYAQGDEVKYARRVGGSWISQTAVDVAGPLLASVSLVSLALDVEGNPHIAFDNADTGVLGYAKRTDGVWKTEQPDPTLSVLTHASIAVDGQSNPHIAYNDVPNGDLKYARRTSNKWSVETLTSNTNNSSGQHASLVLDSHGAAHISYYDSTLADLRYTSAAIAFSEPTAGEVWPVGSQRIVRWEGTGLVDLYLSVDGGFTWQILRAQLSGGLYRLLVPHAPTRFARLKLERQVPRSVATTPGLFTIETSVELLTLKAQAASATSGGVVLTWQTRPGPEDLAGYRVERADHGAWRDLAFTRETTYTDSEGTPADRYRLSAVNGLGDEVQLGETGLVPLRPIAAWPLPYRSGELSFSFIARGRQGSSGSVDVAIYDIRGRRVRTLTSGLLAAGYHSVTWNGQDDDGIGVSSGVYFARVRSGDSKEVLKFVVLR